MSRDRLLTLMQLAEKWGWSRSKLWRLVKRGEIPHLVIGPRRDVHFRESHIEAWLLEREVPAKNAPRRSAMAREGDGREEMCRELGIEPDHQFT